jgi:hypothetical protein
MRDDAIIAALLLAASAVFGSWYASSVVTGGGRPGFYQEQFGPAVMLACGHGYVNPESGRSQALDEFLNVQTSAMVCSGDLARINRLPLTSMQRAFRYLISTVGWTWRIERRVTWTGLIPLYGLLYGLTIALAYAIFRQGMGRIVAGLTAAALAVSTLHMSYLVHLRDYAKAPFVLGLVWLAMQLVRAPMSPRGLLTVAGVAGLVTGLGVGFRNDLLVAVPALVTVCVAFLPFGLRERPGLKASAAGVYLIAFFLIISPMLTIYQTGGGGSSQHLMLLGLGQPFTEELGIETGGLYEWGYDYKDELAHAMINAYADRRLNEHRYLAMYGADYDRAATKFLVDVAENFPADMLLRVYASALNILELPYRGNTVSPPPFIRQTWVLKAYGARMRLLRAVAPIWPWTIVFTLAALSVYDLRIGLFAALMVLYLAGYPALQFNERHYFHLEFIGWWAFAFAVSQLGTLLAALSSADRRAAWIAAIRPRSGWEWGVTYALVLGGSLSVLIVGSLWILRTYQQRHVRQLLQAYVDAPEEPLPMTHQPLGNGWTRFDGPSKSDVVEKARGDDGVHADYIVVGIGGGTCDMAKIDVTLRYGSSQAQLDFSRTIAVRPPPSPGVTRLFLPVYAHGGAGGRALQSGYAPAGLDVPDSVTGCVASLAHVRGTRDLPVFMGLVLPPRWEEATLYGTLAGIEARDDPGGPKVYTFPRDMQVQRSVLLGAVQRWTEDDLARQSGMLAISGNIWHVSGVGGRGRFLYLAEMKMRAVKRGSLAVAQGRLIRGGISFGLVHNGEWAAQVPVTLPGDFAIVLQVPDDGEYEAVLSNYVVGALLRYEAIIDRAGWILDAGEADAH